MRENATFERLFLLKSAGFGIYGLKNPVLEMEGNAEISGLNNSGLSCTFQNVIASFHSTVHYRISGVFFLPNYFSYILVCRHLNSCIEQ